MEKEKKRINKNKRRNIGRRNERKERISLEDLKHSWQHVE
jgi:hypothetical protein